jgi:hypothetical protein
MIDPLIAIKQNHREKSKWLELSSNQVNCVLIQYIRTLQPKLEHLTHTHAHLMGRYSQTPEHPASVNMIDSIARKSKLKNMPKCKFTLIE